MLAKVIPFLSCPHCQGALASAPGQLRCVRGHAFDIARQGYVSLLGRGTAAGGGDTAAMVAARAEFLATEAFSPLARALAEQAQQTLGPAAGASGCLLEAGAGTGYYLAALLDRLPGRVGLALDLSRPALRRAARAHDRMGAVACDVLGALPVQGGSVALALSVFAPRNVPELHRVLRPGGTLIVATPTGRHLTELVATLDLLVVDPHKQQRLAARLGEMFALVDQQACEFTMALAHPQVAAVAGMGPSAFHQDRREALGARIAKLGAPVTVTASLQLTSYRRV